MSRQNHILHFHISKTRRLNAFDKIAVIAAFAYPLTGIPQVISVLRGESSGISLPSWFGFIIFAAFFLVYGVVHRIKPMIITNALWLLVDCLVVAGVIIQRMS